MPTYEYRCRDCGEDLEVVQAFTDDPLTTCPACGGSLRKVFGSVGITFKGSGFYKTDSRSGSNGRAKADKAESSAASSGDSSSSSSSDSTKSDGAAKKDTSAKKDTAASTAS